MGLFTIGTRNKPLLSISFDPNTRHVGVHTPDDADRERWTKAEIAPATPQTLAVGLFIACGFVFLLGFGSWIVFSWLNGPSLPGNFYVNRTTQLMTPPAPNTSSSTATALCNLEPGGTLSGNSLGNAVNNADHLFGGASSQYLVYTASQTTHSEQECKSGAIFEIDKDKLTEFTSAEPDHARAGKLLGLLTIFALPLDR